MAKEKTAWQTHLMATYNKMKAKDKSTKFSDAMKEAKKSYKK
jgi:hypothetical protein